jgi:hypothetical protein
MHYRDMSQSRRAWLFFWLAIFVGCTFSLFTVMQREFDATAGLALAVAFVITFLLSVGASLIHEGYSRGHVPNRAFVRLGGWVLFIFTWVLVFLFNTSNAYYIFTHKNAVQTDVRDLHLAFKTLDQKSAGIVENEVQRFTVAADAARKNVIDEIVNKFNPGFETRAKAALAAFNNVVGAPVDLLSGYQGVGKSQLPEYVRESDAKLKAATQAGITARQNLGTRIGGYINDGDVRATRTRIDELLNDMTQGGSVKSQDQSNEAANRLHRFLEKAFTQYKATSTSVTEVLRSPLLQTKEAPGFVALQDNPYSSQLKVVGKIFEPGMWDKVKVQPLFWAALFAGLLVDLAFVSIFYFRVLRED